MPPKPSTDNPFSAGRLRPGALEFWFAKGDSLKACFARLEQNGWWGQIRGPHGSGKSTLLAALIPHLESSGRQVQHFTLHDQQRRLPVSREQLPTWTDATQVIIDGYEQLSRWNRWKLIRHCRRRGCGLLITTHHDLGLPDIYVTQPTPDLARRLAARLQEGWPTLIQPQDVDRCYAEANGDLRETFFALYDLFEERRQ